MKAVLRDKQAVVKTHLNRKWYEINDIEIRNENADINSEFTETKKI